MTGPALAQVIADSDQVLPADAVVTVGIEAAGSLPPSVTDGRILAAELQVVELNAGRERCLVVGELHRLVGTPDRSGGVAHGDQEPVAQTQHYGGSGRHSSTEASWTAPAVTSPFNPTARSTSTTTTTTAPTTSDPAPQLRASQR